MELKAVKEVRLCSACVTQSRLVARQMRHALCLFQVRAQMCRKGGEGHNGCAFSHFSSLGFPQRTTDHKKPSRVVTRSRPLRLPTHLDRMEHTQEVLNVSV